MDFESTIIQAVKKSAETTKKEVKYYSTKFEPPKKIQRSKTLSANIQKFLARQKEEEKHRALEAQKKKDHLLSLRAQDKKASRRVNVMLKRTKSASQSVMQDAVSKNNTEITLAGSSQPDEDDYGYVSQSASEYYNKLMEKYNSMPDEPKFNFEKKKSSSNLNGTKERVKAALNSTESSTHKRKSRSKSSNFDEEHQPEAVAETTEKEKAKIKLKPAPVINFNDLLKLAEKKQFEPVVIEKKTEKEEERLLTKKEKLEKERDRELREQREKREKERALIAAGKMPKPHQQADTSNKKMSSDKIIVKPQAEKSKGIASTTNLLANKTKEEVSKLKSNPQKCDINNKKDHNNSVRGVDVHKKSIKLNTSERIKEDLPKNLKLKQQSTTKEIMKAKSLPLKDQKLRQPPPKQRFETPEIRRNSSKMLQQKRKRLPINKGRFYDDDDEEYDSEMDDFIDDGPEGEEDYSKYISEIFGYDKKKYRHIDDEDDNMESSFAQQMREEVISTKIGMMEDLEEARKEEEHNRQKALIKKKLKL